MKLKRRVSSQPKYNVVACVTREEVRDLIAKCREAERFGVDTETTGCDPRKESPVYKATAFSVQVAIGTTAYFVPAFVLADVDFSDLPMGMKYLVTQKEHKAVYSNAAYDFHVFANLGMRPQYASLGGDTQVMSFTYNSGYERHGLKEVAKRLLGADTVEYKATFSIPKIKKDGKPGKAMRLPDLLEVVQNKAEHVDELFRERLKPFRDKISGSKRAAQKVFDAAKGRISLDAIELIICYAALDPIYSLECFDRLKEQLEAKPWADGKSLYEYYTRFERPLTVTLWRMTRRGIALSRQKLLTAKEKCERDIADRLTEFNRLAVKAGADVERMQKFNTASGKDIAWLFTEVLGVRAMTKRRKNGTESESWDAKTLEKLAGHRKAGPLVKCLLGYRNAAKILSTYIDPLLKAHKEYKGRVHTSFRQTGTATGRLSSAGPNLQNIPAAGRKDPYGIRECFVASEDPDEDLVLGDIDQAQVEARLTAHFSQDETMMDAINRNLDMHSLMAARAIPAVREYVGARTLDEKLLKEIKEKFPGERQQCKIVNFSVIYGTGARGLSETLECDQDYAQELIDGFFATYPGVKRSMRQTQSFARDKGYVRSLLRRYVYCLDAQSSIRGIRARGERQSFNYKVQGCLAAGSRVLTTAGYVPIEQLNPVCHVLQQPSGRTTSDYKMFSTGSRHVFRVYTSGGSVEATAEHRFMTFDGDVYQWKRLKELKPGDFIIDRHLEPSDEDRRRVTDEQAELLGALVGDGNYSGHKAVTMAIGRDRKSYRSRMLRLMADFFGKATQRRQDVVTAAGVHTRVWTLVACGGAIPIMRAHGFEPVVREEKRVPQWVFSQPAAVRGAFLRGLFDTDGSCAADGGTVNFTSCGYYLVSDVAVLLSSLGIRARVVRHGDRAFRAVVGTAWLQAFHDRVGFSHKQKAANLDNAVVYRTSEGKRRVRTDMPVDVMRKIGEVCLADPAWPAVRKRISASEGVMRYRMRSDGLGSTEAAIAALNDCRGREAARLLQIMETTSWVKITAVEKVPEKRRTFDLQINGDDHGYVAHGLVQHNSDADMMKIAMVKIDRDRRLRDLGVKLRLQVHDELVFTVPSSNKEEAKVIIDDYVSRPMEACGFKPLSLATPAETDFGPDWASAKG